jgi:ABC-type bacteriocin/lantibiotic exporter with double-glycine peptidase domain
VNLTWLVVVGWILLAIVVACALWVIRAVVMARARRNAQHQSVTLTQSGPGGDAVHAADANQSALRQTPGQRTEVA